MVKFNWNETKGEIVIRSRLKEIVARQEGTAGRRIEQKDIAEATGLTPQTISRWMSPRPFARIESATATELCKYLGCTLDDLLYFDELQPVP